jgi:hypothetical protein
MPIHDTVASTVNLAKSWLFTLDRSKIETAVPTETLRLWLETLIDLGTPSTDHAIADAAARTVMGMTVRVSEAEKARG